MCYNVWLDCIHAFVILLTADLIAFYSLHYLGSIIHQGRIKEVCTEKMRLHFIHKNDIQLVETSGRDEAFLHLIS